MSDVMTEYRRLLAGLEACRGSEFWVHMRILADAAEDAGDQVSAVGWRRMTKLRMLPVYQCRPARALSWAWACKYRFPYNLSKRIGGLRRKGVRPPITFTNPDYLRRMEDTAREVGGWPAELFVGWRRVRGRR